MRNLLLTLITCFALSASAQTNQYPNSHADLRMSDKKAKKDTAKKYNYFVVIPVGDYQQLANALNEYKRSIMFDPAVPSDQKVKTFQGIEQYLKELPARLKIDSVLKK